MFKGHLPRVIYHRECFRIRKTNGWSRIARICLSHVTNPAFDWYKYYNPFIELRISLFSSGMVGCGLKVTVLNFQEREFFIGNPLVCIHFIIEMIWWAGLAPLQFEFPFPGSLKSTFIISFLLLLSVACQRI